LRFGVFARKKYPGESKQVAGCGIILLINYMNKKEKMMKRPNVLHNILIGSFFIALLLPVLVVSANPAPTSKVDVKMTLLKPGDILLKGVLGENINASLNGRLKTFITGTESLPITIFNRDSVAKVTDLNRRPDGEDIFVGGGWLGEHTGKWLITAARAADRTNDEELVKTMKEISDYLISVQEEDGYLGTYAPSVRMTAPGPYPKRTWDVWVHSYLMLAFLEMYHYWPEERYLNVVTKIGDLCVKTFGEDGIKSLAYMGNHLGLSGTILLDPIVELYKVTGDQKYLSFAEHIIKQMEDRPGLEIVSTCLAGHDLEEAGDGKIYQLNWNFIGIAKLYEITGKEEYLKVAQHAWQNTNDYHLTLGGGPWGGVGRHAECFNQKGYFSPYGFVETCNTMSWIQFNKQMLHLSGDAKYAEAIEVSAYNSMLGAQYPNGEDWCYFIFPNGRRHQAIWRDCCKSSGALGLEEIAPALYGSMGGGASINVYSPSEGTISIGDGKMVKLVQETSFPFEGEVKITVHSTEDDNFPIYVRIPSWSKESKVMINDKLFKGQFKPSTFLKLNREWSDGDVINLKFPMEIEIHNQHQNYMHRNIEVYRLNYLGITRGPLVYATGLIDGYKPDVTLKIPQEGLKEMFSMTSTSEGSTGPAIKFSLPGREPIVYLPYYETGGRVNGAWRLTWLPYVWE
jgi:DUF1680 family protein